MAAEVGMGEGPSHTQPQLPHDSGGRGFRAKLPRIHSFLDCLFISFQANSVITCYHNREHLEVSWKSNR